MHLTQIALIAYYLSTLTIKYKTSYKKLTKKIYHQSNKNINTYNSLPKNTNKTKKNHCNKIKTFATTYKTLHLKTQKTTTNNKTTYKTNLKLIRTLKRTQI